MQDARNAGTNKPILIIYSERHEQFYRAVFSKLARKLNEQGVLDKIGLEYNHSSSEEMMEYVKEKCELCECIFEVLGITAQEMRSKFQYEDGSFNHDAYVSWITSQEMSEKILTTINLAFEKRSDVDIGGKKEEKQLLKIFCDYPYLAHTMRLIHDLGAQKFFQAEKGIDSTLKRVDLYTAGLEKAYAAVKQRDNHIIKNLQTLKTNGEVVLLCMGAAHFLTIEALKKELCNNFSDVIRITPIHRKEHEKQLLAKLDEAKLDERDRSILLQTLTRTTGNVEEMTQIVLERINQALLQKRSEAPTIQLQDKLREACFTGNIDKVTQIISDNKDQDLASTDDHNRNMLHRLFAREKLLQSRDGEDIDAIFANKVAILNILLDNLPAEHLRKLVEEKNSNGNTPVDLLEKQSVVSGGVTTRDSNFAQTALAILTRSSAKCSSPSVETSLAVPTVEHLQQPQPTVTKPQEEEPIINPAKQRQMFSGCGIM